jgi:hypothetical protein
VSNAHSKLSASLLSCQRYERLGERESGRDNLLHEMAQKFASACSGGLVILQIGSCLFIELFDNLINRVTRFEFDLFRELRSHAAMGNNKLCHEKVRCLVEVRLISAP